LTDSPVLDLGEPPVDGPRRFSRLLYPCLHVFLARNVSGAEIAHKRSFFLRAYLA
jgi:hypothetical protein